MKTTPHGLTYYCHENGTSCSISGIGTFRDPVLIIPRMIDGYKVTSISSFAFSRNPFLKKVVLPDTLETIGMGAFFACSALEEVAIPDSVTLLDYEAFRDCPMLSEIIVGSGVTEIRSLALKGIRLIRVSEKNRCYRSIDGNLYTKDGKTLIQYATKKDASRFAVPEGVTTLGNGAFSDCPHLTEIALPDSLRAILWSVFENCTGLKRMVLPEGLLRLGGGAFHGCRALEEVSLGTGLSCIETEAFRDCPALSRIRYGGTAAQWRAIELGEDWRDESPQLRVETNDADEQRRRTENEASPFLQYTVNGDGKTCTVCDIGLCLDTEIVIPSTIDGYAVTAIGAAAFKGQRALVGVTVCEGVREISEEAFRDCPALTEVCLPQSLLLIGDEAFFGCVRLSEIAVPKCVCTIGKRAFGGGMTCISVSEENADYSSADGNLYTKDGKTLVRYADGKTAPAFSCPDGVTVICVSAFSDCPHLKEITLPDSVTEIEDGAFQNCVALQTVSIGKNVTSLGYELFCGCERLVRVEAANGLPMLGAYMFERCRCLREVSLARSVAQIPRGAFCGCRSLTALTVPASVTMIADFAFEHCTALTAIRYEGTERQWADMLRGEDWDSSMGAYTVTCTDGKIAAFSLSHLR